MKPQKEKSQPQKGKNTTAKKPPQQQIEEAQQQKYGIHDQACVQFNFY